MASGLRILTSRAFGLVACLAVLLLQAATASAAPEKVAGGIKFTYHDTRATSVAWAGAWNNWSPSANPLTKGDNGTWTVVLALPAGEQQYKFVVDGQWFADPENPVTAGEFGNSVVVVANDGGLTKQAATSNTAYNPKITIDGRVHNLFEEIFDSSRSRYELTRPLYDIDLGFGIRVSDVMRADILTNINPQKEDVQDYRSRLNWKRGSMELHQPDLDIIGIRSGLLPTWDDPAHLVGNVGIYQHPFGWEQDGFQLKTPKYGFDTRVIYTDNDAAGGTEFIGSQTAISGRVDQLNFNIDRGTNRRFAFDGDAIPDAWALIRTTADAHGNSVWIPGQTIKITATDVGDGGQSFGYGDGATNVFAAEVHRDLPGSLRAGILGRSDRGFHLGRLALVQVTGPASRTTTWGETEQQWFGGGGDLAWTARPGLTFTGEYLRGARRMDLMDRATQLVEGPNSSVTTNPKGVHYDLDEGARVIAGGTWTFAQGDVTFGAEFEHQSHSYPSWAMAPFAPSWLVNNGSISNDFTQFENIEFQRGVYLASQDLHNAMDEWRLHWVRNWRYYLGREVVSTIDFQSTDFDYDARTTWQSQMWFPTGNFWLQQDGQVVGVDRLTLLGQGHAYRLKPSLAIPISRNRNIDFRWDGTFDGVKLGRQPHYAESIFQFGFDVTPNLRFHNDTRWVKYDVPTLSLMNAYVSQFSEFVYKFTDDIHVGLGLGVDPMVIDPVTNEFAPIGRDLWLSDRGANGYVAENNWVSLAPQIAAAERSLQAVHRIQFEAVVRF